MTSQEEAQRLRQDRFMSDAHYHAQVRAAEQVWAATGDMLAVVDAVNAIPADREPESGPEPWFEVFTDSDGHRSIRMKESWMRP